MFLITLKEEATFVALFSTYVEAFPAFKVKVGVSLSARSFTVFFRLMENTSRLALNVFQTVIARGGGASLT